MSGTRLGRWIAAILAATGVVSPFIAQAQLPATTYRVAILVAEPLEAANQDRAGQAMIGRLAELGHLPGKTLLVEVHSTEGRRERANAVAAELVALRPDLVVVPTCGYLLDAMRRATRTIPILVAACTDDMVAAGIVASLARPGGNVTGLQKLTPELSAKRLELLKEVAPRVQRVAVLWDPDYSTFVDDWRTLRAAAATLGVTLLPVEARSAAELEAAFAAASAQHADAMVSLSDPMTFANGPRVSTLARQYRLPVVTPYREAVEAGTLLSYGPNVLAMIRRAGEMADRILKGMRPAEMPVEQPARFELLINITAAKFLGLTIPHSLLLRADDVIQ